MEDTAKLDPETPIKRLQALEAENAELRKGKIQSPPQLVVVETEYKGHHMLEFRRGNARPFSMGLKKLEAIQKGCAQIITFFQKHKSPDTGRY